MKKKLPNYSFLAVIALSLTACGSSEFRIYSDRDYENRVETKFNERRSLAKLRDSVLFGVLDANLSIVERQGLKFLYAYMPLSDLADYSGDFFLDQVRWSLSARETFAWGSSIPEDLFRHFVLPYRVNNENLDTARIVFFRELKDRIKNLSMLEAALEVNHWCHEKVTYRGSDIRTSAPLASLRTAYGRCGEESTFTVTALRAVSIPARQVYTPRWAHSDDNHAWVEFWADGHWYYLGACEPECVPNLGWFSEPARRAMLIHTKAFGDYQGSERVENQETNYALLNTLPTYAPAKEIHVQVLDDSGKPAENAVVEFTLYNYAEFYPISTKKTDKSGFCDFLTGFGDLLVWARTDSHFGFQKITVADVDTLRLTATQNPLSGVTMDYDMIPPIKREPVLLSVNCRDQNNLRIRIEDSIRAVYEGTFRTESAARAFATSLELDPDETWDLILRSRGNYREIEEFLNQTPQKLRPTAISLLHLISDKDLRDTRTEILNDHLINGFEPLTEFLESSAPGTESPGPRELLNPRVANEMLTAYRSNLLSGLGQKLINATRKDPETLIRWIEKEIKVNVLENYYSTPLSPMGVFNLRVADEDSRKIFTVACFRTIGIPSRLRPGTLDVEYWDNWRWKSVSFSSTGESVASVAKLVLKSDPANRIKPQYETHFSLARFNHGKYTTLAYGYEYSGDPLDGTLEMAPGYYLLLTGNRGTEGEVLTRLTFFELKEGEESEMTVTLRQSVKATEVLGAINPEWKSVPMDSEAFDWKEVISTGRAVLCWIEPDKEPSKHVFQDLALLKKEIDNTGCRFVFIIPEKMLPEGFTPKAWNNLPANSRFVTIPDLSSLEEVEKATGKSVSGTFPVVISVNQKGEITYLSTGYKIGIGEEIIKNILLR